MNEEVLSHITVTISISIYDFLEAIELVASQKKKMKRIYFTSWQKIPHNQYENLRETLSNKTHLGAIFLVEDFYPMNEKLRERLFY